jgi:AraC-like DNA-binding protein
MKQTDSVDCTVVRLRALLAGELHDKPFATLARMLGVSGRTLRRRLRDAGTCFHAELKLARLRAARHQLVFTDIKIIALALELGFRSPQHFSTMFRRETGLAPSAWRAARRAEAIGQESDPIDGGAKPDSA